MEKRIEANLREIRDNQIENLLKFFETGTFDYKNASFVRAYRVVMDLAEKDDKCPFLYEYFKRTIEEYTDQKVKDDLLSKQGIVLIQTLSQRWANHKYLVFYLEQMFRYLNLYYLKQKKLPPLALAGVTIFNDLIFKKIRGYVQRSILDQIYEERNGNQIDISAMKECLSAFVQMGALTFSLKKTNESGRIAWEGETNLSLYQSGFEEVFLVESLEFYEQKAIHWISTLTCVEYLKAAKKCFLDEERRLENYLDRSTEIELMKILTNQLVTKNAKEICNMEKTGCEEMLNHRKLDELKLLFSVLRKDEKQFVHIEAKLREYIETKGTNYIEDRKLQEDAIEYTKKILGFKAEIDEIIEKSFENHAFFQRCRDLAFQHFLNKNPYSAEYIASYCDYEMKKGLKGVSEDETDKILTALVKLFVCLHDRDVFIRFYTIFLAKRLLDENSVSDEAENAMISKLKVECGNNLVRNIYNMYQDKAFSEGLMKEFKMLSHKGSPNNIMLTVQVLRSGCWPEQAPEVCLIPKELDDCFAKFKTFYLNKHSGRNLVILNNYGNLELGTLFCAKSYTCVVSPYQATLLLLFDLKDEYTIEEMKQQTKISEKVLKVSLLPFFNPKAKLLLKQSSGKAINNDEIISLNMKFNSASIKVSFLPKRAKKVETNQDDNNRAIEQERKFILDSVIVRIAKGRKTIKHPELMAEVIRQVNTFKPQPNMIKAQIESLIQREFLKRDDDDRSLYIYLP